MDRITHRVAEERSLALHREVARRILRDPGLLERARKRVERWASEGSVARCWIEEWAELLRGSVDEVAAAITDPSERGRSLRQTSPFAGAIDSETRWAILRRCERERTADDA